MADDVRSALVSAMNSRAPGAQRPNNEGDLVDNSGSPEEATSPALEALIDNPEFRATLLKLMEMIQDSGEPAEAAPPMPMPAQG